MSTSEDRRTSLEIGLQPGVFLALARGERCAALYVTETLPGGGAEFEYEGRRWFVPVRRTRRISFDGAQVNLQLLSVSKLHNVRVVVHAPRSVEVRRVRGQERGAA